MIRKLDYYDYDFGHIELKLKEYMDLNNISINRMSKLANVKYEIVKKYYYSENYNINFDILAKFCYILDCDVSDLIVYVRSKKRDKIRLF